MARKAGALRRAHDQNHGKATVLNPSGKQVSRKLAQRAAANSSVVREYATAEGWTL